MILIYIFVWKQQYNLYDFVYEAFEKINQWQISLYGRDG